MANKVLEVKNLSKVYKGSGYEVTALDKVSFELKNGELLAIMGTSGSGKSTLLNILGALDEPSSGKVILDGKETNDFFKEPKATIYRRDNIGFIFQSFNLLKDLTVEENIALPLVLKGINKKDADKKVKEMLQLVSLTKWKRHRPIQLSGGQQQRVAIARALITSPPIVLADELTGNLDFNTTQDILNVLVDMKKRLNKSMIIVTHDPNVALYSDRVLFFHDGNIVDEYKSLGQGDLSSILNKFQKIMERDQ
ncbi:MULTISPECIES: ABC transporter ATP-binding protein [Bacillus]|uniref:Lipoprotein-releasing system ATP-binding protein n=1 Tax=Bacillus amyloliquefaciens (strain Y2) TaxID=1155777 RepID=I2C285_BACAY|nr:MULTISPECIES: ABC transporter ATP-binding protein [Bacillus]AFJ60759.1 Lipoprotein-releasing system ATP-binding protein [Bacillus velezensis YAU B9601-Y2]AJE77712.1 ABC transporter ATP-binding protein [Bacillus sp. BH072]AMQ73152.1 ABC transporter ATP-binding protein [Bacillus amyloliquefaciens UMAF6614]AUG34855.1 ABC transporter ATP-binding protein [Bacillus velezensis]AWM46977.1 ABC transporter ATP-binding protein [Bacillus amyloliquefaciens]